MNAHHLHHPHSRQERLQLLNEKTEIKRPKPSKVRARRKEILRDQETQDAIKRLREGTDLLEG